MLLEKTLYSFLEELGSKSPAPGGGSVAALNGASACALLSMVCNLTLGKKKYEQYEEVVLEISKKVETLGNKLTTLIQTDTDAFTSVRDAFSLPNETMDDRIEKQEAIEYALKDAALVPLEVMELSLEGIKLCVESLEKTNKNTISDLGSAAVNFGSAIKCAYLNVMINLKELSDKDFINEHSEKARSILELSEEICDKVYKMV